MQLVAAGTAARHMAELFTTVAQHAQLLPRSVHILSPAAVHVGIRVHPESSVSFGGGLTEIHSAAVSGAVHLG